MIFQHLNLDEGFDHPPVQTVAAIFVAVQGSDTTTDAICSIAGNTINNCQRQLL